MPDIFQAGEFNFWREKNGESSFGGDVVLFTLLSVLENFFDFLNLFNFVF